MDSNQDAVRKAATSAMDRLKATARNRRMDPRKLILRFALERWLHRLSRSSYADEFTLKGGMLMPLLGDASRPTEDIDGNTPFFMDEATVRAMVETICVTRPSEEDGLEFDTESMKVLPIRDGVLPGSRVTFSAWLKPVSGGPTELRVKLDLCHGDAITPDAVRGMLPSAIKGVEATSILMYPWPTMLAEKLHAISRHGAVNTRMKDFYDLVLMSRSLVIDGGEAVKAVQATFRTWGQDDVPEFLVGLSDGFAAAHANDWKRFTRQERGLLLELGTLAETISEINEMTAPILSAASRGATLSGRWDPRSRWSDEPEPEQALRYA
jgi:hypothetical protein